MEPLEIIRKYYTEGTELYEILLTHSRLVTEKALEIAERNPQEEFDLRFVYEAAMLHDIGIYLTNAPKIHCHGSFHYICHGYLGADLMRTEGFPRHALVCERHTGTGISLDAILRMNLPVPHRAADMLCRQVFLKNRSLYGKNDRQSAEIPCDVWRRRNFAVSILAGKMGKMKG